MDNSATPSLRTRDEIRSDPSVTSLTYLLGVRYPLGAWCTGIAFFLLNSALHFASTSTQGRLVSFVLDFPILSSPFFFNTLSLLLHSHGMLVCACVCVCVPFRVKTSQMVWHEHWHRLVGSQIGRHLFVDTFDVQLTLLTRFLFPLVDRISCTGVCSVFCPPPSQPHLSCVSVGFVVQPFLSGYPDPEREP